MKSKVKRITNELDEKKKLRIHLTNMRASGELDKEQYRENMNAIKIEVDRLENEKASLEDSLNNSDDIDKLAFLKNELENFLKFDTLTKDMLNLLVEKIEVHKSGEPVIYYKFAPAFDSVI